MQALLSRAQIKHLVYARPTSTLRDMQTPLISSWRTYERHTFLLSTIQETLYHDQNTCLPIAGELWRSEQIGAMKEMVAQRKISNEYRSLLEALEWDITLDVPTRAEILWAKKESDRALLLGETYMRRGAEVTALAEAAWARAKSQWNSEEFLPLLSAVIEHAQEGCERIWYELSPYEVCLDEHQRGLTLESVENMCEAITSTLVPLSREVLPSQIGEKVHVEWNAETSLYMRQLLGNIGVSEHVSHVSVNSHGYMTTLGPRDIRISLSPSTDLFDTLKVTLHEGWHALYELAMDENLRGSPRHTTSGMAVHEARSRLYEICVGQSPEFFTHIYRGLSSYCPELASSTPEQVLKSIIAPRPSLIRTESDPLTYHLHIVIRTQLERALIEGRLALPDLESAWGDAYEKYLTVRPESPREGFLQDVHWSAGYFGYFPCYSLGTFFAAQCFAEIEKNEHEHSALLSAGKTEHIRSWHRDHIDRYGAVETLETLSQSSTGSLVSSRAFETMMRQRYATLWLLP